MLHARVCVASTNMHTMHARKLFAGATNVPVQPRYLLGHE